ncbi:hypothetical protein Y032_0341g3004 [Ancylostoma ceylanicum]|uniref:Reverse transcriptase domain-containing protein n=2 Tax=Ancylostoma ceylanicum TaxID=53326 RepID=A0A016RXU5_9BILA|nr:hypothetical protein Y032_0341g3004 [Ancylostoma ceylanicum]
MTQQVATMSALLAEDGTRLTKRIDIEHRCEEFYRKLFSSKKDVPLLRDEREEEEVPDVLQSEVRHAISNSKNDKAPGPDGITNEMIKAGGYPLWKALATLFTECIRREDIPDQWRKSSTIIIPKKGDREDLKNYRPIALLPAIYKIFTKVLMNRIVKQLDSEQPREQAGFRSGYSTLDHLQTINQLLERCREYTVPVCLIFVDFEKAFDSIEINAVTNALIRQNVPKKYVRVLHKINKSCSTSIRLFYNNIDIPISRGVRQGDTISPKLFTAALEDVFKNFDWSERGVKIDGERLHHLRFADDIVLIAHDACTATKMLKELNESSESVGLRINRAKTKAMLVNCAEEEIMLESDKIEIVDNYIYLGQQITNDHTIEKEIRRRRCAAWSKFKNMEEILRKTKDVNTRAHLFNTNVLPALLYGCETWTIRETDKMKLLTTQRAMERKVLQIRLRDRIRNEEIRKRTLFKDAYDDATERKLRWAGHVARRHDNRWTQKVTFWCPWNYSRPQGRPPDRWRKQIEEKLGRSWQYKANDRREFRRKLEDLLPLN